MVIKLYYKGKEMAHVDKNDNIIFTVGPDLNPIIDASVSSISQVEDDIGNVVLEKAVAPIEERLMHIQEWGFEIKEEEE